MAATGFALDEYIVPKTSNDVSTSHTVPKAPLVAGSFITEAQRTAYVPAPGEYNKEFLSKSFNANTTGGNFSKLSRGWNADSLKPPPVGSYETTSAQTTPRIRGGQMAKRERGCFFYDDVVDQSKVKQSPGKYEYAKPGARVIGPSFNTPRTQPRNPKGPNPVGPGYYNLNMEPTEPRTPSYSASKEPGKSFIDQHTKDKVQIPGPGTHVRAQSSKVEDRAGTRSHAARLLGDRIVTPRAAHGE